MQYGEQLPFFWKYRSLMDNNIWRDVLALLCAPGAAVRRLFENLYKHSPNYKLGLVVIIKNEAPYLREFLEYYQLIGFNQIIVYDNESTDATKEILSPYIQKGYVEYHYIKGKYRQLMAYNDALWKHRYDFEYLAFLDADEFLYSKKDIYTVIENIFVSQPDVGGGYQLDIFRIWGSYSETGRIGYQELFV